MATPILADLRAAYPGARITAMSRGKLASLLQHDPNIDELFAFSVPQDWTRRQERRELIRQLRLREYDLGLLLTNSFSSAWCFCRGRVEHRVGFRNEGRGFLLHQSVPFPKQRSNQHLVDTYKALLDPLGISKTTTAPRLYLKPEESNRAHARIRSLGIPSDGKIVGINPGAAYGSAKCWLPERFAEVTQRLLADPLVHVFFFGDAIQLPLVKSICRQFTERVHNLAGATSLRELMALIRLCDVLLTNDSGPMHMAAALETPVLALFGSTSAVKTGPYGQPGGVIHKRVACSPCYLRACPVDFRCMKRIETAEVCERLQQLLRPHDVSAVH